MATGALHRHQLQLLDQSAAINTDATGTAYLLNTRNDEVTDAEQSFMAAITLTQGGGATSPTSQVFIQTSNDNVTWINVAQCTQLTADGVASEVVDIAGLCRYVRAVTALSGGGNPDHTAKVYLVSNAPFTSTAQA